MQEVYLPLMTSSSAGSHTNDKLLDLLHRISSSMQVTNGYSQVEQIRYLFSLPTCNVLLFCIAIVIQASSVLYCGILPLQGKVVLPLPSVTTLAQTAFTSPDRHSVVVHVLETAVVTWMKQVKMALYCNPTGTISRKAGKFAGPLEEIKVSIKKK